MEERHRGAEGIQVDVVEDLLRKEGVEVAAYRSAIGKPVDADVPFDPGDGAGVDVVP